MPPTWQVSVWFTDFVGNQPIFDDLMQVVASNFFAPQILTIILLCLWFGTKDDQTRQRNQKVIIAITIGTFLASAIAESFVLLQDRIGDFWPRPYDKHKEAKIAMEMLYFRLHDPSFPSNAICIFTVSAAGAWFASRKASIALWGVLTLWALGRIYVGIHYPVDIAGGIALGAMAALAGLFLVKLYDKQVSALLSILTKLHLA